MKVKCISNKTADLIANNFHLKNLINVEYYEEIEVGNLYWVAAIEYSNLYGLFLYINTIEGAHFPTPYHSSMFTFIDTSIPTDWISQFYDRAGNPTILCTVPFWIEDETFYEKLLNSDQDSEEKYQAYRLANDIPTDANKISR